MMVEKKEEKSAKKGKATAKKEEKLVSKEDFVAAIERMNVLELAELAKTLEERFGVSASIPVASVAQSTPGREAPPKEEEKTSFDVILAEVGEKKIPVIKEIRAITNLGLKESKDFVESAPKPIKEKVEKKEAEEIKKRLEAVGAKVEIK